MLRLACLIFLVIGLRFSAQTDLYRQLDSILTSPNNNPFSGVVFIAADKKPQYMKVMGFSDLDHRNPLQLNDKFVIGSISKQITAVLVLQLYEQGKLKLNDPISKYLKSVPNTWDTVTIDQLLSHTHGIIGLDKPLVFKPGSRFMYSQHGYQLLAMITEKITGLTFAEQSRLLFKKCGMKNTCHPSFLKPGELVTCFTRSANGSYTVEAKSLEGFPAAGGFVSTAGDLFIWNQCLYGGKLISNPVLKLMLSPKKNAVRDHPIFGNTLYGYGITVNNEGTDQFGQTGFADGFACMDFYFPSRKRSVIVLQNTVYDPSDMKKTFYYHKQIVARVKKAVIKSQGKK